MPRASYLYDETVHTLGLYSTPGLLQVSQCLEPCSDVKHKKVLAKLR